MINLDFVQHDTDLYMIMLHKNYMQMIIVSKPKIINKNYKNYVI